MRPALPPVPRPVLRPGLHLLRRDARELQIGLDPRQALILPATEEVVTVLGALSGTGSAPSADPLLEVLREHGLLIDERAMRPPAATAQGAPEDAHLSAALAHRLGDEALVARQARSRTRVSTATYGHRLGQRLRGDLDALLSRSGLATGPGDVGTRPVAALVGVGEPDRALLDGWMRDGTPHLLVRMSEGHATVGPFVVPGRTACLRCLDAHASDADPAWPLLVAQYARASARDRADGAAEPVDPALAALALAWAARDLGTYADGGRPSTWSSTVRVDPELRCVETRRWLRHPECGCGWSQSLGPSVTMEA